MRLFRLKAASTRGVAGVVAGGLAFGGLLGPLPAHAESSGAVVNAGDCSLNQLPDNDDGSTSPVLLPFRVDF